MIRSAHSHTPRELQQMEEWHQKMAVAYKQVGKNGEELGLKGQFGPDQLKMVAEKLLGRAISANLNGDVLRATIEFSLGHFKGNYSADVYNRASDLYFDIPPLKQERNVLKRFYVYLDQFTPIKYLPLSVFPPPNQGKKQRIKLREREVIACMTHLSRVNFFNRPFTKDEQATIQPFRFKQALQTIQSFRFKQVLQTIGTIRVRCFKGLDEGLTNLNIELLAYVVRINGLVRLKNRLVSLNFKHALVGALTFIGTNGLIALMNTAGFNTWRDPNDLANLNANVTDTTDFCHYYINYPIFEALSHTLDQNLKNTNIDRLSKLFLTCQKHPISSRVFYIMPSALSNGVLIGTIILLRKIAIQYPHLFDILQELVLFTLKKKLVTSKLSSQVENSKKIVEVNGAHMADTEIDSLEKHHVRQIQSLLADFIKLRSKALTALNEGTYSEARLEVQRYGEIAARLQANESRILKHLSGFKQDERENVKKALSKASEIRK